MGNVLRDPKLVQMLASLHRRSVDQQKPMDRYFRDLPRKIQKAKRPAAVKEFLGGKLVALEPEKGAFCYQLCRALKPKRIVEIGTSSGVSTLYFAAALRDNARAGGEKGVVIGTEYEPLKASAARTNFVKAGLSEFIDLRQGDLRETLNDIEGPVDFVLIDIWIDVARPALEMVSGLLRPGAIVLCDNTTTFRKAYKKYFNFVNDPANCFRTMTLPFSGGLELTVRA